MTVLFKICLLLATTLRLPNACFGQSYVMPSEEEKHEATWLQWPHNYGWDYEHIQRYENSWIAMTKALTKGELVYIIVYNKREKRRVRKKLNKRGVDMTKVRFFIYKTNDVWVRDNGPIFVYDENNALVVQNWEFNGWGGKTRYWWDNRVPKRVGKSLKLPVVNVDMVNEGGSVEIDGRGTLMAKRSSILNSNRNPGLTQAQAEDYFQYYLGVTNFIWLDGVAGAEITDDHIDGTARFANGDTIVTFKRSDFLDPGEYDILQKATDADGNTYKIVHLPITEKKIGGWEGIYVNYYIGNEVILLPIFDDPADAEAKSVMEELYPDHEIVGIEATELYKDGGMAHCVTQQQPFPMRR